MGLYTIALFGEAEKGEFCTAYYCKTLPELEQYFGNPPAESLGLYFAVQTLLYQRELIFFRVQNEGMSLDDYFQGLYLLKNQVVPHISAVCVPGVGNSKIIEAVTDFCSYDNALLIMSEADLYDYLTEGFPIR